jgi:lipopolysaccharide transport system permease protein
MDRSTSPIPITDQAKLTRITANRKLQFLDFMELWNYRDLFWILGLRDLKVRYNQTIVGAAWAIIQPVTTMLIFTVLFKLMGRAPTDGSGIPYALTMFCALLPWQLVATSLSPAATSIVTHQNMVKKIYFPKVVLPVSALIPAILDYAISLVILLLMMLWYQTPLAWPLLMVPVWMVMCILATIGMSLWLSALSAIYRDFMYTIPFILQIGFFISAVIFETRAIVPEQYWALAAINPMVTINEGLRWAMLGADPLPLSIWLPGLISTAAIFLSGLIYFRRMERHFADRV